MIGHAHGNEPGTLNGARQDLRLITGGLQALPAQNRPCSEILSPVHRTIVAVDIEASTTRTDTVKARLRATMYDFLEAALNACGITEAHRDPLNDRGDGALILIHPIDQTPKTLLLGTFIPILNDLLAEFDAPPPNQLRLRAAVHAGEVNYDRRGCFGEAVDLTFRLLDSPTLKMMLRNTSGRLMFVVSDHFYQSIVRHGYNRLDESPFTPLVHVEMAGHGHIGWVPAPEPQGGIGHLRSSGGPLMN